MNFRVEPAIVGFWVRRRLRLEAKLARLMPKLPPHAQATAKCRILDHFWQLRKMSPLRPLTLIMCRGEYFGNVRQYLHGLERLLYAAE